MKEKESLEETIETPSVEPAPAQEPPAQALALQNRPVKPPLRRLPWYTGLMMWTHLAFSRDLGQHRDWSEQVEGLHMMEALPRIRSQKTRSLVRHPRVWRRISRLSKVGTGVSLAATMPWIVFLLPLYAVGHGFGWLAALTFLLPVPIAWKVGNALYRKAAIGSISDAQERGALFPKLGRYIKSGARTFMAGHGFGFTLVFLQGLITYFMTPAPTLALELFLDFYYASIAGVFSGLAAMFVLTPWVAYSGRAALTAPKRTRQLSA